MRVLRPCSQACAGPLSVVAQAPAPTTPRRCRLLLDVGNALGTLDSKLSTALAAQHSGEAAGALRAQFGYAVAVLDQCCILARAAQLSTEEMVRFVQCGALIVGSSSKAVLSHWLRHSAAELRRPDARQPPDQVYSRSTVPQQLDAAISLLQLLLNHADGRGQAAFAADVWRPELVTQWLATVLVVEDAAQAAGAGWVNRCMALVLIWRGCHAQA